MVHPKKYMTLFDFTFPFFSYTINIAEVSN